MKFSGNWRTDIGGEMPKVSSAKMPWWSPLFCLIFFFFLISFSFLSLFPFVATSHFHLLHTQTQTNKKKKFFSGIQMKLSPG